MSHLSIIPQKFSFTKPAICEGYGILISLLFIYSQMNLRYKFPTF